MKKVKLFVTVTLLTIVLGISVTSFSIPKLTMPVVVLGGCVNECNVVWCSEGHRQTVWTEIVKCCGAYDPYFNSKDCSGIPGE